MIKGKKVILRPLNSNDIVKIFQWHNSMNLKNLAMMHPFPIPIELEREHFERQLKNIDNKTVLFGIDDIENKEFVGFTKIYNINWIHRTAYFGIVIGHENSQGKGLGKETTELILEYAFNNLQLLKILLEVVTFNEKAINLYKKIGFETEGLLKRQVYIDGSYHDVVVMSIFKENFNTFNQ